MTALPIVVVGGGTAGLSAAWELQQQGIPYRLAEAGMRWGGKVITAVLEHNAARVIVNGGAETFITRKPEAWALAHELGIQGEIVPRADEISGAHVLYNGRIHPIPVSPRALLSSRLLTWPGKLRLLAEPLIPPRRDTADETLVDFARRRLGVQAADRLIGPILGGIYNADPNRQSVKITAPHMRDLETRYGSLTRGMLAMLRAARERRASGQIMPPRSFTFRGGAQTLIDALVERLTGDLRLGTVVEAIIPAGQGFRVALASGETWDAGGVIVAVTADQAAALLRAAAPLAAEKLAQIEHGSIGTLALMYRSDDLRVTAPIQALMIPRGEGQAIDAVTIAPNHTPGYGLVRVFFGGARPDLVAADDPTLLGEARRALADLLAITAEPVAAHAFRWPQTWPLARAGHLDHLAAIEAGLPPGVWLAGCSYRGLGVPDCIRQGRQAATAAAQFSSQFDKVMER
jgi:oxygen-dependent protoporphyrinogen oxidase